MPLRRLARSRFGWKHPFSPRTSQFSRTRRNCHLSDKVICLGSDETPTEKRPRRSKMPRRGFANVDGHKSSEEVGMGRKRAHGATAELRLTIEQQEQASHQPGTTAGPTMSRWITA